jgi:hypothetical protein
MNVQQKEIIRLVSVGYNTVKEVSTRIGETENRTIQELKTLQGLGVVESNPIGSMWFGK